MPATEPIFPAGNANYPPQAGQALADLLLRTPFWLCLPITFNNADASVLYTVPAGQRMHIHNAWWEVTVGWTGGAASTIGVSSSDANYNTKGDILGAAAGDVAAVLVTAGRLLKGTAGTKGPLSTTPVTLAASSTIRHDRITSAFTAGAGNVHLLCSFLPSS